MIRMAIVSIICVIVGITIRQVYPFLPDIGIAVGLATSVMHLTESKK